MDKINLFEFDNHVVDTSTFDHLLHDKIVGEFEQEVCDYVGAKYAASFFSASYAMYSIFKSTVCETPKVVTIPSMIPPVVPNVLSDVGVYIRFSSNVNWVGGSYKMTDDVVDSAQRLDRNQYKNECDDDDLLVFSFYPTKPLSSLDGGMVVSNNKEKIDDLKSLSFYGMEYSDESWSRVQKQVGFKAYMSTMQATIASRNLKTLDEKYEVIDSVRDRYNQAFDLNNTSRHLYRIEVEDNVKAIEHFKSLGIVCGIHYAPMHKNEVFGDKPWVHIGLGPVDVSAKRTLSIPLHHKLTDVDVSYIIDSVNNYWR